jgi:hypothetical protein
VFFKFQLEKDMYEVGGQGLLKSRYNGILTDLLLKVFPDYEWLPWKFSRNSRNIWKDEGNTKKFLDWAGKQLGVKEYDDWHKVSTKVAIAT